jgi:hypothetical protein
MADVIKVDDLAGEIVLAVRTYTEEVGEAIEEAVKETSAKHRPKIPASTLKAGQLGRRAQGDM